MVFKTRAEYKAMTTEERAAYMRSLTPEQYEGAYNALRSEWTEEGHRAFVVEMYESFRRFGVKVEGI